jgi:hydroxymethylglutaryl-CoA lyase
MDDESPPPSYPPSTMPALTLPTPLPARTDKDPLRAYMNAALTLSGADPSQLPASVRIVEVSPRDGLQNEPVRVPADVKIALVHGLVGAGLRCVEVTGFVSPRWVPQLKDAAHVLSSVDKQPGVAYPVLVPNLTGFHAAVAAGAQEVAITASVTDAFSRRNVNCSLDESFARFENIVAAAARLDVRVRAYISCVVECPYEGDVAPETVAAIALRLHTMGCYELSLGDTIGAGNPASVARVVRSVIAAGVPASALAIHCHDTRGLAMANVLAAMAEGVAVVDSSVAGLGGCPFAPGAAGNLATEDLVYMLQSLNIDCGPIDLPKLVQVGTIINTALDRPTKSQVGLAFRRSSAFPVSPSVETDEC